MSREQNCGCVWHNVDINSWVLCGYTACNLIENVIKKAVDIVHGFSIYKQPVLPVCFFV